jgi:putative addiction module antidote
MKAKVQKIGNSLGVILPKDVLARMHIGLGDELTLSELPNGVSLSVYKPDAALQLEIAREVMSKRRNILKALAE